MSTIESKTAAAVVDLVVRIAPRDAVRWEGSRAQLEAEGLIPCECQRPLGTDKKYWLVDGFRFTLCRNRPEGMKGPKRSWIDGDNWLLHRELSDAHGVGWRTALTYERQCALEAEIFRESPGGLQLSNRAVWAMLDQRFQVFLSTMPGALDAYRQRDVLRLTATREGGAA